MCGIFGIYAPGEDVARLTYFGLYALQHRGQESAGIAVSSGQDIVVYKEMGLVNQVFDEKILQVLKGKISVGHVRYSTTGSSRVFNAQPLVVKGKNFTVALSHNGNLTNYQELRKKMEKEGVVFETTSDSEVMAYYLTRQNKKIEEALLSSLPNFKGAFSLLILTENKLIAVRDSYGIRPLSMGKINGHFVFASETCALKTIGAEFLREVKEGEMVVVDKSGVKSYIYGQNAKKAVCVFEFIYFARPDSYILGKSLHLVRRRMGQYLAREHPADAHLVIPIPDSGTPSSIGYAEESKIPWGEGLIKNRYIHRTFIQPDQRLRELGVKMKLTPLIPNIKGKKIVIVEDSIVRGTTTSSIVKMLKEGGAREVHVRISSPPYRHPCFYGIDTASSVELIAFSHTVEEIRKIIGADSLAYLSISGLIKALDLSRDNLCLACFNDDYPIKIPTQLELKKLSLEMETRGD